VIAADLVPEVISDDSCTNYFAIVFHIGKWWVVILVRVVNIGYFTRWERDAVVLTNIMQDMLLRQ
jgi:hypothetical protein